MIQSKPTGLRLSRILSCKHCAHKYVYRPSSTTARDAPTSYRRPNYGGFYTALMDQQIEQQQQQQQQGDLLTNAKPEEKRGGVVFYSRLAGYPENRPEPQTAKMYAGVIVPARPEEPLNCCQSGCVHCVWDIYREDIEDYQSKRDEARRALLRAKEPVPPELGGQKEEPDIIGELDPSLQAFIKLEKGLKERRMQREKLSAS